MSSVVRFVGDIHGDLLSYYSVVDGTEASVQVGDFGFGFGTRGDADFIDSFLGEIPGNHRMIRGNHDSYQEALRSKHFIDDGTVEGEVMYIGGASSIDKAWRTPGKDWWPDEELSMVQAPVIMEKYKALKPRVLVTHECPEFLASSTMIPLVKGFTNFPSLTRNVLNDLYTETGHCPSIHIFGHWHHHLDMIHPKYGTRFICLPINGYIDLEVSL